jgi:hypothetical protein
LWVVVRWVVVRNKWGQSLFRFALALDSDPVYSWRLVSPGAFILYVAKARAMRRV